MSKKLLSKEKEEFATSTMHILCYNYLISLFAIFTEEVCSLCIKIYCFIKLCSSIFPVIRGAASI